MGSGIGDLPSHSQRSDIRGSQAARRSGRKRGDCPAFCCRVNTSYAIQTQTFDDASATQTVALERATPTYFDVMGISLIRGRVFDSSDRTGAEPVVIVGATFARQVWGTADPIGQRLRLEAADEPFRTVVGIVGDTRYRTIDAPMPAVYVPLDQSPDAAPAYLTIRTLPSSNGNVADEIKTLLLAKSPKYGIREIVPVTTLLDRPLAQSRLLAGVFAILSATVLVLVAMGVFGVLGEFVRQRRRDLWRPRGVGSHALSALYACASARHRPDSDRHLGGHLSGHCSYATCSEPAVRSQCGRPPGACGRRDRQPPHLARSGLAAGSVCCSWRPPRVFEERIALEVTLPTERSRQAPSMVRASNRTPEPWRPIHISISGRCEI